FLWNSGMFCMRVGSVLQELQQCTPGVLNSVKACLGQSRVSSGKGFTQLALDPDTFSVVPDISVDYALMEKSANVSVVACDIGWSDIGSWDAIGELGQVDEDGNCIEGEALTHDVHNCFIQSND